MIDQLCLSRYTGNNLTCDISLNKFNNLFAYEYVTAFVYKIYLESNEHA